MKVKTFDELMAEARERYLPALSDVLDGELERLILPADRLALLHDAIQFICFLVALKSAEIQTPAGASMDRRDPLRAWGKLSKAIDKAVPAQLLDYGAEVAARQEQVRH